MKQKQQITQEASNSEVNPAAPRLDAEESAARPTHSAAAPPPQAGVFSLRPRLQILLALITVVAALAALVWWLSHRPVHTEVTVLLSPPAGDQSSISPVAAPNPSVATSPPFPTVNATPEGDQAQFESTQPPASTPAPVTPPPSSTGALIVPVAGVRAEDLRDTYQDARSEGRTHNAIDIPAARGTPVVATADGRIVKLWLSEPGGITIYQLGQDDQTIYYYAHLDRYADGLSEGHVARQGEVIGYVGDTGNAGPGNYHLHFSVSIVSDPKRYWEGTNVNPYPLLTGR